MAIARDASTTNAAGSGSSLTTAHTCSGSNRLLIVGASIGSSGTVTGVTYNGVSMTQINTQNIGGSAFQNTYLFYLIAPATGANNVVISQSGTGFIWAYHQSYTGVDQVTPIAPAGGATTNGTGTSLTASITTTVDNSWMYGICQNGSSDSGFTAGANTSLIANNVSGWGSHFDTNGAQTPTGSKSCTMTRGSSALYGINMVAIAPVGSAASVNSNFFNFF